MGTPAPSLRGRAGGEATFSIFSECKRCFATSHEGKSACQPKRLAHGLRFSEWQRCFATSHERLALACWALRKNSQRRSQSGGRLWFPSAKLWRKIDPRNTQKLWFIQVRESVLIIAPQLLCTRGVHWAISLLGLQPAFATLIFIPSSLTLTPNP